MPGPTEQAWLSSTLAHERAKARWRPYKGDPERQCTARCKRSNRRCRAPRLKRKDGTLSPTCRMHGGELGPLESQAKALRQLVAFRMLQAKGAQTKLDLVLKAIEVERGISDRFASEKEVTAPSDYPSGIETSQENQALSDGSQTDSQTSPDGAKG